MVHYLVNLIFFRQEDNRKVCRHNLPSGEELLILLQKLAGNVMAETDKEVNGDKLKEGLKTLLEQNSSLFKQQTKGITTYQLNFISLLYKGIHSKFITQAVSEIYPLNSKSYINRIKK